MILVMIGCSSHTSQTKSAEVNQHIMFDEQRLIEKDTSITCVCGDSVHSVKVISKYLDSTQDSNFVLDQKLIFLKNGIVVSTIELPFNYTSIEKLNNKVRVSKSVLLQAKCLINKSGKIIYSFYGSHTFDPQHEFFSYNDENGQWLWYFYGDRYDTYKKYGNESKFIKEFGDELSSLNNMVKIFPDYN